MGMSNEWFLPARASLENANRELVCAVRAFEQSGGDFEKTINELKQSIGDLECCISMLNEQED